jgi:major type 1 subunit fimbrin (pilin)
MKRISGYLIATALTAFSYNVLAETLPIQGGVNGQISFTGVINNDACSVGGSDANRVISVDMGNVSIKDMGTAEDPSSGRIVGSSFNLNVNCNKGTKVTMVFDPSKGGSGLVTGKNVLALNRGNGAATNVGIALLDSAGKPIDLSSPETARISADMHGTGTEGGSTMLTFSAAYVTTADGATPGRGDATLPFILEYQ